MIEMEMNPVYGTVRWLNRHFTCTSRDSARSPFNRACAVGCREAVGGLVTWTLSTRPRGTKGSDENESEVTCLVVARRHVGQGPLRGPGWGDVRWARRTVGEFGDGWGPVNHWSLQHLPIVIPSVHVLEVDVYLLARAEGSLLSFFCQNTPSPILQWQQ